MLEGWVVVEEVVVGGEMEEMNENDAKRKKDDVLSKPKSILISAARQ